MHFPSPFGRAISACIFALILPGLSGCSHPHAAAVDDVHATNVAVIRPHVGSLRTTRNLAGAIAPLQNIALSNTLAEPADRVLVNEGDHVRAGQLLAVLDTSDLTANYEADIANVDVAAANLRKQRAASDQSIGQGVGSLDAARAAYAQAAEKLRLDQQTLSRDASLLKQQFVPQQTVDTQGSTVTTDRQAVQSAQANLRAAQIVVQTNGNLQQSGDGQGIQAASIAATQAQVIAGRAQAAQIQAQIARAVISAPVDAVVVNRNLNVGEYPNGRTLFVLQQTGRVYAVLNTSPSQIVGIRVGSIASVRPNDGTDTSYQGQVVAVLGQTAPGSSNFTVKVLLDDAAGRLLAGLPVTATVTLAPIVGEIVPRSAFTDATESTVVTVRANVAHLVNINVVAEDSRQAVVTGIHPDDQIVTNGDAALSDGQSVRVQ